MHFGLLHLRENVVGAVYSKAQNRAELRRTEWHEQWQWLTVQSILRGRRGDDSRYTEGVGGDGGSAMLS